MYRIRLYPQHSHSSYNSFAPRAYRSYHSYNSYNSYEPRHISLHIVNTPWNNRRRRINVQLDAYRAQVSEARLAARLQAQYGVNGLYNQQSMYTNPGVYAAGFGQSQSPYTGYAGMTDNTGYNGYTGYSLPAMGYGSYTGALAGYGNGAWYGQDAGLMSSPLYQPAFGY